MHLKSLHWMEVWCFRQLSTFETSCIINKLMTENVSSSRGRGFASLLWRPGRVMKMAATNRNYEFKKITFISFPCIWFSNLKMFERRKADVLI